MIFRSEVLSEQCAYLGPLSTGLAVYMKLPISTENHEFMLSLPILIQHCRILLVFSFLYLSLFFQQKGTWLPLSLVCLLIWSKSHCYLLQCGCPPHPVQALTPHAGPHTSVLQVNPFLLLLRLWHPRPSHPTHPCPLTPLGLKHLTMGLPPTWTPPHPTPGFSHTEALSILLRLWQHIMWINSFGPHNTSMK